MEVATARGVCKKAADAATCREGAYRVFVASRYGHIVVEPCAHMQVHNPLSVLWNRECVHICLCCERMCVRAVARKGCVRGSVVLLTHVPADERNVKV